MTISAPYGLTKARRFFEQPATPRQRQYEALRAFFLERVASAEAARRFGYSPGAFRVLCHAFRRAELPEFFATAHPGPREQPRKSRAHEQIVALRKRNYSVYEISQALKEQGADDIIVFVGGVIPRQDYDFLYAAGVKGIYGPGTPIPASAKDVLEQIRKALKA